jgi:hypothetical protein
MNTIGWIRMMLSEYGPEGSDSAPVVVNVLEGYGRIVPWFEGPGLYTYGYVYEGKYPFAVHSHCSTAEELAEWSEDFWTSEEGRNLKCGKFYNLYFRPRG